MEEALYGEGGYYRRSQSPIGKHGDFITGASFSSLFGSATARLLQRLDKEIGRPADFLEVGYGTGAHLRDLLAAIGEKTDRRILACDRVQHPVPGAVELIDTVAEVEPESLQGLIFSYELFDALPVHRLIGRADGGLGELWVDLAADGRFEYVESELLDPSLQDLLGGDCEGLLPGQIADVSPGWKPLLRQMAERLDRGLILTFDYGFDRLRLLDPRVRSNGTLACYRRHAVHRNALSDVGEQDLTAHVDFTALQEAGEEAGLETISFTRQARWLLACGVFEELQAADQETRLQARTLLNPGGMGEEMRLLVQGKGIDADTLFDLEVLGSE
jgi:SAM-dependent MidA family methyltransferase